MDQVTAELLKQGILGLVVVLLIYLLLAERKRVDRFTDVADKMAAAMTSLATGFAELKGILLGKDRR